MVQITFSSLAVSLLAFSVPSVLGQKTGRCSSGVHVIGAPGSGDHGPGNYGLLGTLKDSIVENIPGSTHRKVEYPTASNLAETEAGMKVLRRYLRLYHESCPDSKIVLLGYSLGAVVTGNILCGGFGPFPHPAPESKEYTRNIIATVLYGDETRQANLPYDLGTCANPAPRVPRPNAANCAYMQNRIQSYCDSGDPECCTGGNDSNDHFVYADEYDNDALNFVITRYNNS